MSISAYVLIDVNGSHTKSATKTMSRMPGVKEVKMVTGAHDIIAFIETDDFNSLSETIISRIRSIDGVTKTMTSIVLNMVPTTL